MNRISVLFAAGALGAAALTAGCSSTASKSASAGAGAATPGSASSVGTTTSSSGTGQNPGTANDSTSATTGRTTAPSTTSAAPTTPTGHAAGTACTTAEMPKGTWRVIPDSEGAGHVAADIALQNTSDHTCTVAGFPAVSLLASNEHPLPTNVLKDTSVTATTIKVAPGAWVHSELRYSPNVPGPGEPQNGQQCEPTTVHALAQLPGDTAWSRITLDNPTPVCEKGELQAKPFVNGESSPDGG